MVVLIFIKLSPLIDWESNKEEYDFFFQGVEFLTCFKKCKCL